MYHTHRRSIYPQIFGDRYVLSEHIDIIGPGGMKHLSQLYQASRREIIILLQHNKVDIEHINHVKLKPNTKDRGYPRITMELTKQDKARYDQLITEQCANTTFSYHLPSQRNHNQAVSTIIAHCFPEYITHRNSKHSFINPQLRVIGGKSWQDMTHVSDLERYDRGDDVKPFQFQPKKPSTGDDLTSS